MSLIPQLVPFELNQDKQKNIVIDNIIKMLTERDCIHPKNHDEYVNNIISNLRDDDTFIINITNRKSGDSDTYHIILLLDQKISTITRTSMFGDYIYKNIGVHKIIVVNDITPRAMVAVHTVMPSIEIFLKKELMFNIIDHIYVPKHILLSDTDAEKVLTEYGVKKKELPRIFITDPIARYYNAKMGQIFRIKRPSEITGFSNYYRIVVNGSGIGKNK